MKLNYVKVFIPILVALLGVFIWTNKHEPAGEETPTPLATRYGIDPAEVTSLEFTTAEGTARMALSDGIWQMSAPASFPADTAQVDKFIAGLLAFTPDRILTETDTADFGFEAPVATITLAGQSGALLSLTLGAQNYNGSSYYAKVDTDGALLLLPTVQVEEQITGAGPNDFRSRKVMHFNSEAIAKIQVDYPATATGYTVEREAEGWQVTMPFQYRARERKIDALFIHLEDLRVENFTTTPKDDAVVDPKLGLGVPQVALTLTDTDGRVQHLELGSWETGELSTVYATATALPEVFMTQQHIVDKLTWSDAEIKEDRLIVFHPDTIGEVEVRLRGADNVHLVHGTGGWELRKPSTAVVEPERAEKFLNALVSLAPAGYLTPEEAAEMDDDDFGWSEYTLKVELKKADTFKEQLLTIGRLHRRKGYYTRDSTSQGVYLIPEAQVADLQRQLDLIAGSAPAPEPDAPASEDAE